ncbi:hypothetical protein BCR44DRAFT_1436836, partial [Catenaria anguillulae PL171]
HAVAHFRRLTALRPTPSASSPLRLHLQHHKPRTSPFTTTSQSQTQTQAQARAIADAKRRAILREDFRLPLRLLKGLLLLLTVSGGTLTLHTLAVHTFAEHSSPTPAALDFWTRTHLRRAYMLEHFQHDPYTALKYVQKAVEEEAKWAQEKGWAMWKKEYLQLVMRLAHAYLLARRVDEAARVVARVSEELHAKLVVETTTTDKGQEQGEHSVQIARLAKLLVQVDGKLAGLYVRMGQAEVAREVAADAVVAGALMAWADACKAGYLAQASEEARVQAVRGYEEVLAMTSAQNLSVDVATDQGMPQLVPAACMAAIASYHLGDLLTTQRYRALSPAKIPEPASPSATLSSSPHVTDILTHFQSALSLASMRPNARQCQECQAATFSTVGQVFFREGDEIARQVGDVEGEEACERGLKHVGVAVEAVKEDVTEEERA